MRRQAGRQADLIHHHITPSPPPCDGLTALSNPPLPAHALAFAPTRLDSDMPCTVLPCSVLPLLAMPCRNSDALPLLTCSARYPWPSPDFSLSFLVLTYYNLAPALLLYSAQPPSTPLPHQNYTLLWSLHSNRYKGGNILITYITKETTIVMKT